MPFVNQVKCLDGSLGEVECGLVVKTDDEAIGVPLESVSATVTIINIAAEVTLEQTFVNNSSEVVQCVYFFPTEDNVALHSFKATLDDRTLTGIVKDKQEAREEFVNAVEQNKTAFLLEEVKPDILELFIGNLKAGSKCVIQVKYVLELGFQEFKPRFTLPTTIAPRYIPPSEPNQTMEQVNYQFQTIPDAPLTISVNALMRSPITGITSPTHTVVTNICEQLAGDGFYHGKTELQAKTTSMDKDFVLICDCEDPKKTVVIAEKHDDEVALMISFVPEFNSGEQKCEFIFLVDCSGSMGGGNIEKARDALKIFLQSLPEDCYFNIYRFGSSFECAFPKSVQYNEKNLKTAKKIARTLDADLGGTEILPPIQDIFTQDIIVPIKAATGHYKKQVIILTDGAVSNTSTVIGYIRENIGNGRVFSLGIGESASRELVKGIAQAGNGTSLFCTLKESMHEKVIRLLSNAVASSTTIYNIECTTKEGSKKSLNEASDESLALKWYYPKMPLSVFSENKVTVYMLIDDIPVDINVLCESGDDKVTMVLGESHVCEIGSDRLAKLAAHKIITKNTNDGHSLQDDSKQLALKYGIVSPYTSIVCVDEQQGKISTSQQLKKRTQFDYEYHDLSSAGMICAGFSSAPMFCPGRGPPVGSSRKRGPGISIKNPFKSLFKFKAKSAAKQVSVKKCAPQAIYTDDVDDDESLDMAISRSAPEASSLHGETEETKLIKILDLPNTKGVFLNLSKLCNLLGQDPDRFTEIQSEFGVSEELITTMLAVQALHHFYKLKQSSWMMIEKKSLKWIGENLMDDAKFQAIKDRINSVFV